MMQSDENPIETAENRDKSFFMLFNINHSKNINLRVKHFFTL